MWLFLGLQQGFRHCRCVKLYILPLAQHFGLQAIFVQCFRMFSADAHAGLGMLVVLGLLFKCDRVIAQGCPLSVVLLSLLVSICSSCH